MCVDVSGGREGAVTKPFLNLLHRYAVHHHQAGTAVAQVVEPDVRQTILPEQPFKMFRHEVGPKQLAFLIGADEVQIIGAVALAEQPAVKLLLFLLLEQFGLHGWNQRQSAAAGLVLHHVADDRDILAVHPLFCDLVVDGHGLPLKVNRRPLQPQHLTPAQTIIGRDEDAQVKRVILRDFQQLLDLVLGVEVGPETILLGPVHFQHRVDFQIVLAHGILERLAEDGVVVDDGVGGAAIQQNLLLKVVQYLRRDLAEFQAQRLEVLRDATLNHLVVADKGGCLDGCLVDLNPLVEIIQKQHRYMPNQQSLFPMETEQYDTWMLRELLNNCIAHSYYQSGERIYVNECEDSIVITNPGSFLPQTVEAVLQPTYNPPFYRNQLLADAMVKFHMIDTATSGIKKVYRIQKEKFFPLPDYNLSNVNQVAVTVYGKILDEKYTQLLYKNNESLDLETVFLLDKIQKHVQITKEQAVRLKKRGLVEGRYPNIYVSFKVASMVGKKAEYVHNKGLDENICRQLILEALKNAPTTQHELLEVLDVGALPGHLSTEQKSRKLSNILQKMKKEGLVKPTGSRRYAVWSLV